MAQKNGQSQKTCCHCDHKATPRSSELKSGVSRRINRAIGQLNGIKTMIDEDRYCGDVLIQLAAVRSAINNTGKVVLKNHMNHCIVEAVKEHDMEAIEQLNKAIDQFMK